MPIPQPKVQGVFDHSSNQNRRAAMGAVKALTADGLFIGQSAEFFEVLRDLAADADAARRECESE